MVGTDSLEASSSLIRKRSSSTPLTPPLSTEDAEGTRILDKAVHVLATESLALTQVTMLYQTDLAARDGLLRAVECITKANEAGGKLLICGVGKSGLVGSKTVATMKSLGLGASFLHASEAIHGDLGDVRLADAILFMSYSGKTQELLHLVPHLPESIPILVVTSGADCPLLAACPGAIHLPAPIHESEEKSFGVCAPTTSTTVAIAIGDMLAIAVADAIHSDRTKHVFRKNHPGGAIGAKRRQQTEDTKPEKHASRKRHRSWVFTET